MSSNLREQLKQYIPKYLWEVMNHPPGYKMGHEEFNAIWNLIRTQGDYNTNTIRDLLQMLYNTVLNDIDGASHLRINLPQFQVDNVKQVINLLDQKLGQEVTRLDGRINNTNQKLSTEVTRLDGRLNNDFYNKNQSDTRFVNRSEIDTGASVAVIYEVFVIEDPDDGQGGFTYRDREGTLHQSFILNDEYQVFKLTKGDYVLGENRLSAYVNDTLHRSKVSGGLLEIDSFTAGVAKEGAGTEITFKYYTIKGAMGSSIVVGDVTPPKTFLGKIWLDTGGE